MANVRGLRVLQARLKNWEQEQMTSSTLITTLGIVGEIGELAHAVVKYQQGVRGITGKKLREIAEDALVDALIFILATATHLDIDLQDALNKISEKVLARNWREWPEDADEHVGTVIYRGREVVTVGKEMQEALAAQQQEELAAQQEEPQ